MHFGDRQTHEQMNSIDAIKALSLSWAAP